MKDIMEITKNFENDKVILNVSGRIDTVTSSDFQQQVLDVFDMSLQNLVLDCQNLEYISSSGLRALLVIAKLANCKDVEITLKNVNSMVLEVLEMSGFDSFFTIGEN